MELTTAKSPKVVRVDCILIEVRTGLCPFQAKSICSPGVSHSDRATRSRKQECEVGIVGSAKALVVRAGHCYLRCFRLRLVWGLFSWLGLFLRCERLLCGSDDGANVHLEVVSRVAENHRSVALVVP